MSKKILVIGVGCNHRDFRFKQAQFEMWAFRRGIQADFLLEDHPLQRGDGLICRPREIWRNEYSAALIIHGQDKRTVNVMRYKGIMTKSLTSEGLNPMPIETVLGQLVHREIVPMWMTLGGDDPYPPTPSDVNSKGENYYLTGNWTESRLNGYMVRVFKEHKWSPEELKNLPVRFGSCIYWNAREAREHGLQWVANKIEETGSEVKVDFTEASKTGCPYRFWNVRDSYWRSEYKRGYFAGEYKQMVRQYIQKVILWDDPDKLYEEWRLEGNYSLGGKGAPAMYKSIEKTSSGYWDAHDQFRNTGALESTPRHWIDFSCWLDAGEEPQETVKPEVGFDGNVRIQGTVVREVPEFRRELTAWQDEYNSLAGTPGTRKVEVYERDGQIKVPATRPDPFRQERIERGWKVILVTEDVPARYRRTGWEKFEVLDPETTDFRSTEDAWKTILELQDQMVTWSQELEALQPGDFATKCEEWIEERRIERKESIVQSLKDHVIRMASVVRRSNLAMDLLRKNSKLKEMMTGAKDRLLKAIGDWEDIEAVKLETFVRRRLKQEAVEERPDLETVAKRGKPRANSWEGAILQGIYRARLEWATTEGKRGNKQFKEEQQLQRNLQRAEKIATLRDRNRHMEAVAGL